MVVTLHGTRASGGSVASGSTTVMVPYSEVVPYGAKFVDYTGGNVSLSFCFLDAFGIKAR